MRLLLPLLVLVSGCAWITPTELANRKDFDKDGFRAVQWGGDDCDDTDPNVYPGAPETWYDGVMQDCTRTADNDQDGDGVPVDQDCDDTDSAVQPAAIEICNGKDDDCDDQTDEADDSLSGQTYYADADEDDHGDPDTAYVACAPATETDVTIADDCDDSDAARFLGNPEVCDGIDNDCNTAIDDSAIDGLELYVDADLDGFGDPTLPIVACALDAGLSDNDADCDDGNGQAFPGAPETCSVDEDFNCDGFSGLNDNDGDGAPACLDCDDDDNMRFPGKIEACNNVDDDCDNLADDEDPETPQSAKFATYTDADSDGYGDPTSLEYWCDPPATRVLNADDCDDTTSQRAPNIAETAADGVDQDCDGEDSCPIDADGDGFGIGQFTDDVDGDLDCTTGQGVSSVATDCADDDPFTYPGAAPKDGSGCLTDVDEDDYGDLGSGGTDCDDTDALTFPGAAPKDSPTECMRDADGDDFGDNAAPAPIATGTDCDDSTTARHPHQTDLVSNGIDENCDKQDTCYADADGDHFGSTLFAVDTDGDLDCSTGTLVAAVATDCDDTEALAYPGAAPADDPDACMRDADLDDYGDDTVSGDVIAGSDCDDDSALVSPAIRYDYCGDGLDNDCAGGTDECTVVASEADQRIDGTDSFGSTLAVTGAPDPQWLAIGASAASSQAGGVYVFGLPLSDDLESIDALATWTGGVGSRAGAALSALNTNSDSHGDLVVGAPGDNVTYVMQGPFADGAVADQADAILDGPSGSDFGAALAAGPFAGDAAADLVVGAPLADIPANSTNSGSAHVFLSPLIGTLSTSSAVATIRGFEDEERLGHSVLVHDFDGDGSPDLVVAGAEPTRAITVYKTPTGSLLSNEADFTLTAATSGHETLFLDQGGDVDGDGVTDLLVGAPGAGTGGRVYLFTTRLTSSQSLNAADVIIEEVVDGYTTGAQVRIVPDRTNDGYDEILIGGPQAGIPAKGMAYLFLGSDALPASLSTAQADLFVVGENSGDELATAVLAAELDGDGEEDLLFGAPGNGGGTGATYLFTGSGF